MMEISWFAWSRVTARKTSVAFAEDLRGVAAIFCCISDFAIKRQSPFSLRQDFRFNGQSVDVVGCKEPFQFIRDIGGVYLRPKLG
jgi:hypothetical protein